MKNYGKRTVSLLFGLFLYAFGIFLSIQANIGLAPWDAFSMGWAHLTNLSYGNITVIVSFVIIILDFLLKEKLGFGSILNALLIGKFVDLFEFLNIIPMMSNFWYGLLMLILGQTTICVASYFYIGAAMGCGPRDALMVAVGKRFPKVPIGIIRGLIEAAVLSVGWLLGAKVGIGTILSAFGIGLILQLTFKLLRFDVKSIKHEDVAETVKELFNSKRIVNNPEEGEIKR